MGRKKQSPFEDLIEITSFLPWWVGLFLALISYLVLHKIANMELQPVSDISHMGSTVAKQIYKSFAGFGQIVLPIAFVLGAGSSVYSRFKRKKLFDSVAGAPIPKWARGKQKIDTSCLTLDKQKFDTPSGSVGKGGTVLNEMTWQDFEVLVGEFFRRQGYTVYETGGGGADGGVDLRMNKDGQKYFVQCKQWKAFKVGVKVVRELFGVMSAEGATGAFIVTSGLFTAEAEEFAVGKNIALVDGLQLQEIIQSIKTSLPGTTSNASLLSLETDINQAEKNIPFCPRCKTPMVKRVSTKCAYAGKPFWGCSQYPKCKTIVPWQ